MMDEAEATPAITARVAKNLIRMRESAGFDRATLEDRAILDEGRVARLEAAEDLPDHNEIWKIAGALGVDPGKIYEGITWMPPVDGGPGFEVDDQ
jgi:transcriptional regulator with XRE-family HTH domain